MTFINFLRGQMAGSDFNIIFSSQIYANAVEAGFGIEGRRLKIAYESGALDAIRLACNKPYEYKNHFDKAQSLLVRYNMDSYSAAETVAYYGAALGFPGYCTQDARIVGKLTTVDGESEFIYEGEIVNGRENGIGQRSYYYGGAFTSCDTCVWVNGEMFGYWTVREIIFECVEANKIGFIIKDRVANEQTTYDDGDVEYTTYKEI